MNTKRFNSLFDALKNAVCLIVHYVPRHVGEATEGRERKETSVIDEKTGMVRVCTQFPTFGVNKEFDSAYIRCPFDSGTEDTDKDRYHHTTVDVGSIVSSTVHKGVEIFLSVRDDKGRFQPTAKVEFDTLCPVLPDVSVEAYRSDRENFGLLSDELYKATSQAKKRGLIAKEGRGGSSGRVTYRIDENRKTWTLAGLPSNPRFAWAKMYPQTEEGNATLLDRISFLETTCNDLADKWRVFVLPDTDNAQVFRILDAGLVEAGKATYEGSRKNDPSYVSPDRFHALVKAGKVEIESATSEKVVGKVKTLASA